MARDPLRSTLDNLQVDPEARSERPYLEAALRRMGYTESEIRERLGAADPAPARPRAYRLVKPVARPAAPATDAPFEALSARFEPVERPDLEFAEVEDVEFSEVQPEPEAEFEEIVDFGGPQEEPQEEFEVTFEEVLPPAEEEFAPAEEEPAAEFQEEPPQEPEEEPLEFAPVPAEPAEDAPMDTFGGPESVEGAAEPRTRVRVRRVRARSRAEAEAKIAGQGGRVIKSIPVDIVERWGPEKGPDKPKGGR